jgi:hypothetical protein
VRCAAGLLAVPLALGGCSGDGRSHDDAAEREEPAARERPEPEPSRPTLAVPPEATTVVPGDAAADLAASASSTFFEEAPVVVLAPADDLVAQARAASAAVALGGPLLLSPPPAPAATTTTSARDGAAPDRRAAARARPATPGVVIADELRRLAPEAVLAFGRTAARWAREQDGALRVVVAPDDPEDLRSFGQLDLDEPEVVALGGLAASVAGLPRDRPPLLTLDAPPPAGGDAATTGGDGTTDEPGGAATGEEAAAARAGGDGAAGGDARPDDEDSGGTGDAGRGDDADDGSDGEAEAGEGAGGADAPDERLPAVDPAEPVADVLVVVERADAGLAAVATARASGARVVASAGTDPRTDRDAIAALAEGPVPDRVVAFGSGFGPADRLRRRLEVAATGVELPGGGQVVFPGRRMVALYGHPGAPVLGVLGEQPADAAVARAQRLASGYDALVDEPVVPAFEIITTVASGAAGPDGDYSSESEVADLRPWVDAAGQAGMYVMLDLQPGRTDFLTQAQRYEELLAEPHVGLALDPEWRLGPNQRHMAQIGSVGVDEVNAVAAWLAGLTRERRLPQKLLLLHQFQLRMIGERGRLDTGHDELAVLVHADGFGTPGQKLDTWRALRSDPLAGTWWGWKNFIDEDRPTFTPEQTVAVDPTPWFVSYQ